MPGSLSRPFRESLAKEQNLLSRVIKAIMRNQLGFARFTIAGDGVCTNKSASLTDVEPSLKAAPRDAYQ